VLCSNYSLDHYDEHVWAWRADLALDAFLRDAYESREGVGGNKGSHPSDCSLPPTIAITIT
jgi:hypothetical protein